MKKNVLLVGQADHDNFGDSLIYYCYIKMLRGLGHEISILNPSEIFLKRLSHESMEVKSVFEKDLSLVVDQFDLVVFIPGGYMGCPDITDFNWQRKWIKENYFKDVFNSVPKCGNKVLIHGVEAGPNLKPFVSSFFKAAFDGASSVYVRNTGSKKYLKKQFGIEAKVLPDYILGVHEFIDIGDVGSAGYDLGIHITGKVFAENVIANRFLLSLIESIKKSNIKNILLFSDQPIKDGFKPKLDFFIKMLPNVRVEVRDYTSISGVLKNVSLCENLLTSKLHVGVCGLVYGCKVISISSHPKLKRFYSDNGLIEFNLNYFFSTNKSKMKLFNSVLNMSKANYFNETLTSNIKNVKQLYEDSINNRL